MCYSNSLYKVLNILYSKFMAYDEKFRERVIAYKECGHTFEEVYEAFGVHSHRYYAWKKLKAETGSLKFRTAEERNGKIDIGKLKELVEKHPDWYLSEYAAEFGVWPQSIQKRLAQMKITRKKKRSPIRKSRRRSAANT